VGVIAKHAQVPVQMLIIETDSPYLSKGWPLFRVASLPITYRVRLGRRFDPPDNVAAFMQELEQEYTTELASAPQNGWLGETAATTPTDDRSTAEGIPRSASSATRDNRSTAEGIPRSAPSATRDNHLIQTE
jgi:hypothetical protein